MRFANHHIRFLFYFFTQSYKFYAIEIDTILCNAKEIISMQITDILKTVCEQIFETILVLSSSNRRGYIAEKKGRMW